MICGKPLLMVCRQSGSWRLRQVVWQLGLAALYRRVEFIEMEAVEALQRKGLQIKPGDVLRNLVTRDVPLNHLVGRTFLVGGVVLRGTRLCEPCSYLEACEQTSLQAEPFEWVMLSQKGDCRRGNGMITTRAAPSESYIPRGSSSKAKKAAVSWSGGKDSYLALHRTVDTFDVQTLLTMFTEDGTRSRSHGLRPEVLARQARLLNFALVTGRGSWKSYEEEFKRLLRGLSGDGFSHVIFGDIFLDEHKMWVERVCNESGLVAIEPLWGEQTCALLQEFLATGARAQIVATKASLLDDKWLGTNLSEEMLPAFEALGVDACGERGEYHTLVWASPLMSSTLALREVGRLMHDGYWMLDLEVD